MELTKKEKEKIFWALVDKYVEHERGRQQAHNFFGHVAGDYDPVKLEQVLDSINELHIS